MARPGVRATDVLHREKASEQQTGTGVKDVTCSSLVSMAEEQETLCSHLLSASKGLSAHLKALAKEHEALHAEVTVLRQRLVHTKAPATKETPSSPSRAARSPTPRGEDFAAADEFPSAFSRRLLQESGARLRQRSPGNGSAEESIESPGGDRWRNRNARRQQAGLERPLTPDRSDRSRSSDSRSPPDDGGPATTPPLGSPSRARLDAGEEDLFDLTKPLFDKDAPPVEQQQSLRRVANLLRRLQTPADVWRGPGTPLTAAVRAGRIDLARLLIQSGVEVNGRDDLGVSALHLAIFDGEIDFCRVLLAARADVDICDCHGQTPLFFAPSSRACRLLVEHLADVSALNHKGQSALHFAGRAGLHDVLSWLSQRAAKSLVDLRDVNGAAARHYAQHGAEPPAEVLQCRSGKSSPATSPQEMQRNAKHFVYPSTLNLEASARQKRLRTGTPHNPHQFSLSPCGSLESLPETSPVDFTLEQSAQRLNRKDMMQPKHGSSWELHKGVRAAAGGHQKLQNVQNYGVAEASNMAVATNSTSSRPSKVNPTQGSPKAKPSGARQSQDVSSQRHSTPRKDAGMAAVSPALCSQPDGKAIRGKASGRTQQPTSNTSICSSRSSLTSTQTTPEESSMFRSGDGDEVQEEADGIAAERTETSVRNIASSQASASPDHTISAVMEAAAAVASAAVAAAAEIESDVAAAKVQQLGQHGRSASTDLAENSDVKQQIGLHSADEDQLKGGSREKIAFFADTEREISTTSAPATTNCITDEVEEQACGNTQGEDVRLGNDRHAEADHQDDVERLNSEHGTIQSTEDVTAVQDDQEQLRRQSISEQMAIDEQSPDSTNVEAAPNQREEEASAGFRETNEETPMTLEAEEQVCNNMQGDEKQCCDDRQAEDDSKDDEEKLNNDQRTIPTTKGDAADQDGKEKPRRQSSSGHDAIDEQKPVNIKVESEPPHSEEEKPIETNSREGVGVRHIEKETPEASAPDATITMKDDAEEQVCDNTQGEEQFCDDKQAEAVRKDDEGRFSNEQRATQSTDDDTADQGDQEKPRRQSTSGQMTIDDLSPVNAKVEAEPMQSEEEKAQDDQAIVAQKDGHDRCVQKAQKLADTANAEVGPQENDQKLSASVDLQSIEEQTSRVSTTNVTTSAAAETDEQLGDDKHRQGTAATSSTAAELEEQLGVDTQTEAVQQDNGMEKLDAEDYDVDDDMREGKLGEAEDNGMEKLDVEDYDVDDEKGESKSGEAKDDVRNEPPDEQLVDD